MQNKLTQRNIFKECHDNHNDTNKVDKNHHFFNSNLDVTHNYDDVSLRQSQNILIEENCHARETEYTDVTKEKKPHMQSYSEATDTKSTDHLLSVSRNNDIESHSNLKFLPNRSAQISRSMEKNVHVKRKSSNRKFKVGCQSNEDGDSLTTDQILSLILASIGTLIAIVFGIYI